MNEKSQFITFLITIRKAFPQSEFLESLNIVFKLLTLFVLTHDWNIYAKKGISAIIVELAIVPTISRIDNYIFSSILTLAYIIVVIIAIVLLMISIFRRGSYLSNQVKMIKAASVIIYVFYYLFNQHFYMLTIESYFCHPHIDNSTGYPFVTSLGTDCRGPFNYILISLQSLIIILLIIVNFFISVTTFDPFFFTKQILLNNIGSNKNQWIVFPIGLMVLQLEYHIPYTTVIILKIIIRFGFVIYFILNFLIRTHSFYSSRFFYYFYNMMLSMCFISCIIEYIFLYDWNNGLMLLQSNVNYMIGKIVIEIIIALSIVYYINYKDHDDITSLYDFNHKDISAEYASYNKYFFYLLHPHANIKIVNQIIKNVHMDYLNHEKKKCFETNKECFCAKATNDDVTTQSATYLFHTDFHEESLVDEHDNLINDFPALNCYLEYHLNKKIEKMQNNNLQNYLQLISALFYLSFQRNVNKSFFYVEEFKRSPLYKNSFICKIQVQLFNEFILIQNENILKLKSMNFLSFSTEFKQLNDYIHIEERMRKALLNYIEFLHQASELEIDQSQLIDIVVHFNKSLTSNRAYFKKVLSDSQCNLNYLSTKLYLYYQFFNTKIPEDVEDLFKDISKEKKNFLSVEEYSTLIINYSNEKGSLFRISYASDNFLNILSYSYGELSNKNLNDIFLSMFAQGYSQYLYDEIQSRASSLVIPNICFRTKQGDCKILFFLGIILFHNNNLHIFAKITPIDCVPYSKLDMFLGNNQKYLASKKSRLVEKDSCYIITNKSGKLIAVSEDFELYFGLKNKFIKTNKVNIFIDILKQNPPKEASFILSKLFVIYDNIADIITKQLMENNKDNYEVDYQHIKTMQQTIKRRKGLIHIVTYIETDILKRPKKKAKEFKYIIFKIQMMNNHPIPLKKFFDSEITQSTISTYNDNLTPTKEIDKELNEISNPSLSDDKKDIVLKFSLIRHYAFKILVTLYRMKYSLFEKTLLTEERNFKEQPIKKPNTKKMTSQIGQIMRKPSFSECSSYEIKHYTRKGTSNAIILFYLLFWIIGLIIFYSLILMINAIKDFLYNRGLSFVYCNLYILVTQKILIGLVCSLTHMQVIYNEMQPFIIDNNYTNTIPYHGALLEGRMMDFIADYQSFMFYYISPQIDLGEYLQFADAIFYQSFNITELGVYLKSERKVTNLAEVLGYLHIKIGHGFSDQLGPMFFNKTIIENGIEYKDYRTEDFKDYDFITSDQSELAADKTSVYLLENTFTEFKYRLDEFVHIFENVSNEHNKKSKFIIIGLCSMTCVIFIILYIIQGVGYIRFNNKIFIKYFMAYIKIQFFNTFIMRKAFILKKLMDMTIQSTFDDLKVTKVFIQSSEEENLLIQMASKTIDEENPLDIHSFTPIVNVKSNSLSKSNVDDFEAETFLNKKINGSRRDKEIDLNQPKQRNSHLSYKKSKKILSRTPSKMKGEKGDGKTLAFENISTKNTSGNNTTSAINQSTEMLMKPEELINKNKKILKPKSYCSAVTLIIIIFIMISILALIHYIILSSQFDTLQTYIEFQALTLQRINKFHELLGIYEISVLLNKEMIVEYQSFGLLNATQDLQYLNNITTHHVFNETMATFFELENKYDKAINIAINNPHQKTLKIYEDIFSSDDFCEKNGEFLEEYKQFLILPVFRSVSNMPPDFLYINCPLIGHGYNLKGFKASMHSLLNNLQKEHNDFLKKEDRDGIFNKRLLNSQTVHTYQTNSHRLLDSIFMNYQVSTSKDYEDRYLILRSYETLFNGIMAAFTAVLIILYCISYSLRFQREYKVIDDIEEVLFSTAVF